MRRIVNIGKTSRGVILPKSWINCLEKKHGRIDSIFMDVNGELIIWPVLEEDQNGIFPEIRRLPQR